jgi:hypothetical protein
MPATQTIEIPASSGLTGLTAKAYHQPSDTISQTASAVVAATNRKCVYRCTFTDLAAGNYIVELTDGSGTSVAFDTLTGLLLATGTYETDSLISPSSGGGGSDPLQNPLGDYASNTAGGALQKIGAASVNVTSPVTQGGTIRIVQGGDYLAANGLAIPFTLPASTFGDLTAATVELAGARGDDSVGPITGSIVNGGTESQTALVEIHAANTAGASPSDGAGDDYHYQLRVTKSGAKLYPIEGSLRLEPSVFS